MKKTILVLAMLGFTSAASASPAYIQQSPFATGATALTIGTVDLSSMQYSLADLVAPLTQPGVPAASVVQNGVGQLANIVQEGSNNVGLIMQYGVANTAMLHQSGTQNLGYIHQVGFNNAASIRQSGVGHVAAIAQQGQNNVAIIRQR